MRKTRFYSYLSGTLLIVILPLLPSPSMSDDYMPYASIVKDLEKSLNLEKKNPSQAAMVLSSNLDGYGRGSRPQWKRIEDNLKLNLLLDNASLSGFRSIRLNHTLGTGALAGQVSGTSYGAAQRQSLNAGNLLSAGQLSPSSFPILPRVQEQVDFYFRQVKRELDNQLRELERQTGLDQFAGNMAALQGSNWTNQQNLNNVTSMQRSQLRSLEDQARQCSTLNSNSPLSIQRIQNISSGLLAQQLEMASHKKFQDVIWMKDTSFGDLSRIYSAPLGTMVLKELGYEKALNYANRRHYSGASLSLTQIQTNALIHQNKVKTDMLLHQQVQWPNSLQQLERENRNR